jgi:hypothetical protein
MKPPQELDILFEQFLQELASDYREQAYEFKAFTRARKIRSVDQLLQVILLYCGLDLSLRGCAGQLSAHQGYVSDTAIKKDWWRVCHGSSRCCRVSLGWGRWFSAGIYGLL